ncbi:MAG: tyrosine-protein phosphatase [Pseudomonadota bacterium]
MPERIELDGPSNFRDLGGSRGLDGRIVRRGRLYRSDALHRLSDKDIDQLRSLEIRAVFDLRYGEERGRDVTPRPPDAPYVVHEVGLAKKPGESFVDSFQGGVTHRDDARGYMSQNYSQYPILYREALASVVQFLINGDGNAVFHCTAGKDRTGYIAAMVLSALGVSREDIMVDYLRTNRWWDPAERVPTDIPWDVVEPIFSAREEYLETMFVTIDQDHGGVDTYLRETVGIGPTLLASLRSTMLS